MYIRTKDGVYEVVGFNKECIIPSTLIKVKNNYGKERITHCCKEEILNQVKTIEELCDLVRFKTKDNATHYVDLHKNTIEDIVVHFGGKNIIIDSFRYCIETDKGLIYVAKMNNEGKLVLI